MGQVSTALVIDFKSLGCILRNMNKEMIYVISPVRQVTPEQSEEIAKHAALLKETGATVFNPVEDAPQDDATGYNIVMSELNFMYKASKEGGRVDILWNMGGKPSEGSRVDVGIAIALGLKTNLITVFNKDNSTGPQEAYRIIENFNNEIPDLQKMAKKIGAEGPKIASHVGSHVLGGAQHVDNVDDDVGGAKFSFIPKRVATVFAASAHCCTRTPSLFGP